MTNNKSIELDICNGLDKITEYESSRRPLMTNGSVVALCHKNIIFKVEVKDSPPNGVNFSGHVLPTDTDNLNSCKLEPGDIITFTEENICYPTQKE